MSSDFILLISLGCLPVTLPWEQQPSWQRIS